MRAARGERRAPDPRDPTPEFVGGFLKVWDGERKRGKPIRLVAPAAGAAARAQLRGPRRVTAAGSGARGARPAEEAVFGGLPALPGEPGWARNTGSQLGPRELTWGVQAHRFNLFR